MSTKLGTLTLDLVAKVTNFTDGIKTAEKQTTKSFDQMRSAVNSYSKVAVAATGVAVAAVGALAISYANTAAEVQNFSTISMASTTEFQRQAAGAKTVGISMEKLADQYKDFNEKLGEFLTIGSGGAVDFFEQIAIKTEGSAEGARKLAIEMQKLSGPKAMQLYVDKLEEAGVSQQQMSFYLESMASDTTNLIPLLRNGGEGFEFWADAAQRAGVIMDEHAIKKAAELKVQMNLLNMQVEGAKNQFIQGLMPALTSVGNAMSKASNETNLMSEAGETLGNVFKGVGAVALGVYASVKMLTNAIAGLAVDAVKAKNIVDDASKSGSIFDKLPGVRAARSLILGSVLTQAPNSGVAMAAQDNKDVAEDIAESINTIFSDAVDNGVKKMAELQTAQAGVIKGSEEWVKKQNEAAEKEKKAAETAKLKYKYRADELVQLQKVAELSAKHGLNDIGAKYGLPQNMLAAVMMQESKGDVNAKSPTGAIGPFQTTGIYRKQYGLSVEDSYDVKKSAEVAAKDIAESFKVFGNWEDAITAYNAGRAGTQQLKATGKTGDAAKTKEAKAYAGHVDKWLAGLNGGSGFLGEDAGAKGTQEYLRHLEEVERERNQIRAKYAVEFADDDWKRQLDYQEQVLELNKAFSGDELNVYLGVAKTRYEEAQKLADMQFAWEVSEHRLTEEQKLRYSHNIKEQEIKASTQLTNEQKSLKLKALSEQFAEEFSMLKISQNKQLLEMKRKWMTAAEYARQSYALVRQEILSTPHYTPEMKHGLIKQANFDQGIAENEEREGKWSDYENRFGGEQNQYQLDHDLLKDALDQKLITEEEYHKQRAMLQVDYGAQYIGSTVDVLRSVLGEESGFYQAAFAMQKAYAVAKVALNAPETYSNVYATVSAIPVVGPYIAPVMAGAAVALQMAQAATLGSVNLSGMAHDGIDNVPKEGTWLLDKGERVVDSRTNADLKSYLQNAQTGSGANIVINVPAGYTAQRSQQGDREVIDIVERYIGQQIQNPNSQMMQGITKRTTATVRR